MKWVIAKFILYPLVYRNYKLRQLGKLPDKWYWADVKLTQGGYLYRNNNKFNLTRKW